MLHDGYLLTPPPPRSSLRHLLLLASALVVALTAIGCANGNESGRDAGRRRDGQVDPTVDAGPNGGGVCGASGNSCCTGRTCELGLRCGRGDVCCISAGSAVSCDRASDCCTGLSCTAGVCCSARGSTCGGSADCCSGLICSSGVCRDPSVDDLDGEGGDDPGESTCGRAGGTCCSGFTCISGLVCSSGTCAECGDEGQACCDGTTSACNSTTLSCNGTTCVAVTDPAYACGEIDQPCCNDSGMPGGTNCTGDLVCSPGGNCIRSTDTGGEGEPCNTRGTCDMGLICDSSSGTASCETVPSDCGSDMQMCCDTNGDSNPDGCAGSENCQFGTCSTCLGPSISCLLDGVPILGGSGCCEGSVCRPAPIVPRCCMGAGGTCTNSTDCCGFMTCQDGTCQAGREGSFCTNSEECGEGLTCQTFTCQPEDEGGTGSGMEGDDCTTDDDCGMGLICLGFSCQSSTAECIEAPEECSGDGTCCEGLSCAPAPNEGEPTNPPPTRCCAAADTACTDSYDCCGEMLCVDGTCACQEEGSLCYSDQDCCEGFGCIGGNCVSTEGCRRLEQSCTTAGDCCGSSSGTICAPNQLNGSKFCGVGAGERCQDDGECTGEMTCSEGECACRRVGESCASSYDCCGSAICNTEGSCVDPTMA